MSCRRPRSTSSPRQPGLAAGSTFPRFIPIPPSGAGIRLTTPAMRKAAMRFLLSSLPTAGSVRSGLRQWESTNSSRGAGNGWPIKWYHYASCSILRCPCPRPWTSAPAMSTEPDLIEPDDRHLIGLKSGQKLKFYPGRVRVRATAEIAASYNGQLILWWLANLLARQFDVGRHPEI